MKKITCLLIAILMVFAYLPNNVYMASNDEIKFEAEDATLIDIATGNDAYENPSVGAKANRVDDVNSSGGMHVAVNNQYPSGVEFKFSNLDSSNNHIITPGKYKVYIRGYQVNSANKYMSMYTDEKLLINSLEFPSAKAYGIDPATFISGTQSVIEIEEDCDEISFTVAKMTTMVDYFGFIPYDDTPGENETRIAMSDSTAVYKRGTAVITDVSSTGANKNKYADYGSYFLMLGPAEFGFKNNDRIVSGKYKVLINGYTANPNGLKMTLSADGKILSTKVTVPYDTSLTRGNEVTVNIPEGIDNFSFSFTKDLEYDPEGTVNKYHTANVAYYSFTRVGDYEEPKHNVSLYQDGNEIFEIKDGDLIVSVNTEDIERDINIVATIYKDSDVYKTNSAVCTSDKTDILLSDILMDDESLYTISVDFYDSENEKVRDTSYFYPKGTDVFKGVSEVASPASVDFVTGTPIEQSDIIVNEFTFQSSVKNNKVYAYAAYPKTPGVYPGILVLHGGGQGGKTNQSKVRELASLGYIAIAPELPGIADPAKESFSGYSQGEWVGYTYETRHLVESPNAKDNVIYEGVMTAVEAFRLLQTNNAICDTAGNKLSTVMIDISNIGVTGLSWGGYTTTMLAGLLGDEIKAVFSYYGSGYYDIASYWTSRLDTLLSVGAKEFWLENFDAGRRASDIKADYFVAAASNDRFFYPPAVMATYNAIENDSYKGLLFSPNDHHNITTAGKMKLDYAYFNKYLKNADISMPSVEVVEAEEVSDGYKVSFVTNGVGTPTLYYSLNDKDWTNREWVGVRASKSSGKNVYNAVIPYSIGVDYYVLMSVDSENESNARSASSLIYTAGTEGELPGVPIESVTTIGNNNLLSAVDIDMQTDGVSVVGEDIVFNGNDSVTFKLNAENDKIYNIGVILSSGNSGQYTVKAGMKDGEVLTRNISVTDSNSKKYNIGNMCIKKGEYDFVFSLEDGSNLKILGIEINELNPEYAEEYNDKQTIRLYSAMADKYYSSDGTLLTDEYIDAAGSGKFRRYNGYSTDGYVGWQQKVIAEYKNIDCDGGMYSLSFKSNGTIDGTYNVIIDDISAGTINFKNTGSYTNTVVQRNGIINISPGKHTIKIQVNNSANVYYVELKNVSDSVELYGMFANGEALYDQKAINRGTDVIEIYFNDVIVNNSIIAGDITLSDGSGIVPCDVLIDGNCVNVFLEKSLDYNSSYNIKLVNQEKEHSVTFLTKSNGDDSGKASVSKVEVNGNYENITVSGIVKSSADIGIAGRRVELLIDGYDSPIGNAVSGVDGIFVIDASVPSDVSVGTKKLVICTDYAADFEYDGFKYYTKSLEDDVISKLEMATNADEVKNALELITGIYDMNLTSDLVNIPCKNLFYSDFIDSEYVTLDDVYDNYKKFIVYEELNQTDSESVVLSILDEKNCNIVGIDFNAISSLNTANMTSFVSSVASMEKYSNLNDYLTNFNALLNEALCNEYNKTSANLKIGNISVKIGQGVKLPLELDIDYGDYEGMNLDISVKDSDGNLTDALFNSLNINNENKVNADIKKISTGVVNVNQNLNGTQYKDVLTAILESGNVEDTYTVELSGKVLYNIDETLSLYTAVNSKVISVSVTKNSTASGSGGGSSFGANIKDVLVSDTSGTGSNIQNIASQTYKFDDLSDVSWAVESIDKLVEKGIISKADDNIFRPNDNITREEFVKMLVMASGIYNPSLSVSFSDVNEKDWFYSYVASAVSRGIIVGIDDNSFGVGENITREEMATMICRCLTSLRLDSNYNETDDFSDSDAVSSWAVNSVNIVKNLGIMNGVGGNKFAPKDTATRAMAAKVIYLMLDFID